MWIWVPVMIRASLAIQGGDPRLAELGSFFVIGAGAIGCVIAGLIADRVGRTLVTSWAMAISGTCCLVIGLLYGGNPVLLVVGCRNLGRDGRCRFGAVFFVRYRARRSAVHRHRVDDSDVHRVFADDDLDRVDSERWRLRMAGVMRS